MKNPTNKPQNLSELVAAYEAILAHEGLAPIDGETFDASFYEKKTLVMDTIAEETKKADKELERLLAELRVFSSKVREEWAFGLLTDENIHEMYREFAMKPYSFITEGLVSEGAVTQLSYGWKPKEKHPSEIHDWKDVV